MGKGKGAITQKVRKVYKGEILFEVSCFKTSLVKLVFNKASKKLPIQTQFI
jgi:ribosomal protein L16/L10AE